MVAGTKKTLRICPRAAVRAMASTPVPASPSFSLRSTAPERERVPPGKKSEWYPRSRITHE